MKTKIGKTEISKAVKNLVKELKRLPSYNEVAISLEVPCCQVNGLLGSLSASDEDSLVVDEKTGIPSSTYWDQTPERRKLTTKQAKENYHRQIVSRVCQRLGQTLERNFEFNVKESVTPKRLTLVEDYLKKNSSAVLISNGTKYTETIRHF